MTPQQQELERLVVTTAERLDEGWSKRALTTNVTKAGFAPDDAVAFVDHVDAIRRARHWRGGLLLLLGGVALIAVGVGITVFTYVIAEPGGRYWVTFGFVLWGIAQVAVGANRMAQKWSRSRYQRDDDG